jgi:hypothetical protein
MRSQSSSLRPVALFLCLALLLQTFPLPVSASQLPPVVTVEVGQPSVWSLGQAHYLLAQMHKRDRGLSTAMPTEADLNPNRANAASLEAVRTLLGVEAQFDQGIGVQNKIALQRFQDDLSQRNAARITLEERRAERLQASQELLTLNESLAKLQVEDKAADDARGDKTPPSAQDIARKQQIAVLTAQRDAKKAQVDGIDAEIGDLTKAAATAPTAPTLSTSPVSSTAGSFPTSSIFTKFTDKFADEATTPSLAASTALDNFVGMQYEIISKQLSLLRDEVGPDERVIFLELPTSIYTVDKWSDNYIAQVRWQVTKYYDREPSDDVKSSVIKNSLENEGKSDSDIKAILQSTGGIGKYGCDPKGSKPCQQLYPITLEMIAKSIKDPKFGSSALASATNKRGATNPEDSYWQDGTRTAIRRDKKDDSYRLDRLNVRSLEIIPQQSALNVNEYHAATNNFSILGVLKLISGFGAKLDYQRQKEVYDKFLQQRAFASGFGKGSNSFGWTFGPLPGSKRIEPGQRTTYAVLAVPRNTLALELKATTKAFKRGDSPESACASETNFIMLVPGEATQRFWIDSLAYKPTGKGTRVNVLIKGSYFSPQLGVLINSMPLKSVISITRNGSDEPVSTGTSQGVEGEYEILNSREIALSFSMGNDFIGTPVITIVTPERSTAINSFPIKINHQTYLESLQDHSISEPMFTKNFNTGEKLETLEAPQGLTIPDGFTLARLHGDGLLPGAEISINGTLLKLYPDSHERKDIEEEIDRDKRDYSRENIDLYIERHAQEKIANKQPFAIQESTQSYRVFFQDQTGNWLVRYRQKTAQGLEERELKQQVDPLFDFKLRHYQSGNPAEANLSFIIPKNEKVTDIKLQSPDIPKASPEKGCQEVKHDGKSKVLVTCLVPSLDSKNTERDFITVEVDTEATNTKGEKTVVTHFADFSLPVRPQVVSIQNLSTGRASGFANEDATVTIQGANLQGVTSVLFGDKEAQILVSGPTILTVKAPKVDVPKGQTSVVPVLLRTASGLVSAGNYRYLGEPLPKVVVSGYPYPQQPNP